MSYYNGDLDKDLAALENQLYVKELEEKRRNYGATYCTEPGESFGTLTAIFEVTADWDGYRYHGYCTPSEADVQEWLLK